MSLEVSSCLQVKSTYLIGLTNQAFMSSPTWLSDTRSPTILISASGTDHRTNSIAVFDCVEK